ncbi:hypothetical protein BaRGS_00037150 [Batillaria attramentaria]|uniref:Uncharacterized protein n=1 Tax=Batillaria attramentaria TaxID=370345 RepID=A0ABD0J9F6_9CAEN
MISVAQQQAAEAERNKRALQGCLTDLPPEQSHSIRVFFSSTFTDMTTERNLLMKEAVPHLRDYCKEKELDFQVVDMRWGIREDASIEHTTTELCLKEIQNCQQTSRGPNFVAFLGDKYGSRTLPITIPVTEYRTLRRLASWMDQDFKAVNKWYLVDTNSVPPVYKIQPITALLPNYNDPDPKKRLLREQHRQTWDRDQKSMLTALRRVSVQAHARKLISDEAFMKYYISVTHDEVLQGVDRGASVQNKVLSFHRSFNIINIEDNIAKRFTDLTSEGEVDEEAKQLREDLKTGTVPKYLTPDQIISNEIEWTSDGIDENNSDHKAYLRTFCDTFTARMMEMIDRSSQSSKKLGFNKAEGLDQEVRVHLRFCREKCETFFGRDAILQRIHSDLHKVEKPDQDMPENATDTPRNLEPEKSDLRTQRDQEIQGMLEMMKKMGCTFSFGDAYDDMESDPNRDIQEEQTSLPKLSTLKFKHPTIIHGVSGSGKTALMAKIVQVSKRWISHSYCIIRFMGATPASSGIHQVLVGIVIHLWQLYKINDPRGLDMLMDFHYLVPYFHTLLWRINSAANPLFLLFDSADQLDSSDYAHTLSWLPRVLPPDVHVFVSMADDHPTCLQNIRYLLPSTDRYIQLGALDKSSADKMIRCVCHRAGRTLTAAQRSLLLQKFENNPQALYLRMITDQSLSWRSNMKAKKLTVADTVEGTIHQLFDTLEKDHGEVVVSHAMAYLTLSPQGLSDSQMEDILSLDDEVLQDTYIFHLPPDPQLIRFASSIWLRIKDDLGDYLAQHRAGKIIMYTWYHRHFHETALQRYGTEECKLNTHRILAEYFLGTWSSQPRPLELIKGKQASYPDCFRGVPAQPLTYSRNIYNIQKLMALPHHLAAIDDWDNFHQTILSVEWMVGCCRTLGFTILCGQFSAMLDRYSEDLSEEIQKKVKDIQLIFDVIKLGADAIRREALNLPIQIIGQLGPNYKGSSTVEGLVQESKSYLENSEQALLVPVCACMPSPGGLLMCSVNINMFVLGSDRSCGQNMCVDEDSKRLYVIEWASSSKPDSLLVVDYENTCTIVARERLPFNVHSLWFAGGNRFLVMQVYEKLSKYDPSFHYMMFEGGVSAPFKFDKVVVALSIASHGQDVAFAYKEEARVHIGSPDTTSRTVLVKHHVSTEASVSLVLFPPSGSDVVVIDSKYNMLVWNEAQHQVSPRPSQKENKFHFKKPKPEEYRITQSNLLLVAFSKGLEATGVKVIDLVTMKEKYFLTNDQLKYAISIMEFDPREEFVAVASKETTIINGNQQRACLVWRLSTGGLTSVIDSNEAWQAVKLIGDEFLTCLASHSYKGVIQIVTLGPRDYPYPEGHLICELNQHSNSIFQFLSVKEDTLLLSAGTDNTLKAWDLGRILSETDREDRKVLLSQRQKKEEQEGRQEKTVISGQGGVESDDYAVFFGTESGVVAYNKLEPESSLGEPVEVTSDLPPVHLMLMSREGDHLIAAAENTLAVFDVKTAMLLYTKPSISGKRKVDCLAEGGGTAIAGHSGMEGKGLIWEVKTGETIKTVEMLYSFSQTAISRSGTKVVVHMFEYPIVMDIFVSAEEDESLKGLDMSKLDIMMAGCICMCVSPNDMLVAACAADGSIRVVTMENQYLHRMQQRSSAVSAVFTPDSLQLVTAGFCSIYVWRMGTGQLDFKLTRHQDFVTSLRFSADGHYLVSASLDRTVLVWDFRSRTTISLMHTHCQLQTFEVTPDLSSVVYMPERVASLAVMQPNMELRQILTGGRELKDVPEAMEQAQACALAFSSQRIQKVTTAACVIL